LPRVQKISNGRNRVRAEARERGAFPKSSHGPLTVSSRLLATGKVLR